MTKSPKNWRTISSKIILQDPPWLQVREQTVELPNGHVMDRYYTLDYPDWVCVIAITKDSTFILEQQYRHSLGMVGYELPAGVVDEGETLLEAAKRELLEETGYGGGNWTEFMSYSGNPATTSNLCHCFIANEVERMESPTPDITEDISIHHLSKEEIIAILKGGEMQQSMHQAPLWRYFYENYESGS